MLRKYTYIGRKIFNEKLENSDLEHGMFSIIFL